jgi:hypothetical protein
MAHRQLFFSAETETPEVSPLTPYSCHSAGKTSVMCGTCRHEKVTVSCSCLAPLQRSENATGLPACTTRPRRATRAVALAVSLASNRSRGNWHYSAYSAGWHSVA